MSSKNNNETTVPVSNYATSLEIVPEAIQVEVGLVVDCVKQMFAEEELAMIWLFGSYTRGEAIRDRRIDPDSGIVSEYHSDVDILVVVYEQDTLDDGQRWVELQEAISRHSQIRSCIHLINESLPNINHALAHSEYFYMDVISEGIVVYNNGTVLAQPEELSPAERRSHSIDYFQRFYKLAYGFQRSLKGHYQLNDLPSAIYSLHQMTEHLFFAYLLVFTHYKPRTHKLRQLKEETALIDPEINNIFLIANKADEDRFKFFDDAYVDSHYLLHYEVEPEALDVLIKQVSTFQRWVVSECLKFIDGLVPEENYSRTYQPIGNFIDLNQLKAQDEPQTIIYKQLEELKAAEVRESLLIKDRDREREEKQNERIKTLKERQAKEAAMNREANAIAREAKEREEKERLLKKMRDAGLEP